MKILFAISIASFLLLAAYTFAAARHIRKAEATPQPESKQAPRPAPKKTVTAVSRRNLRKAS